MNKVLIAEDEKMIRQGIKAIVSRAGVSIEAIIECKNGQEAYDIISRDKIDVLITDIRMPKMDGITLVKEIQKLTDVPRVIVISGYDDFSYAVELLRCGAREYLLKPINRDDITRIMKQMEEEIQEEKMLDKEHIKLIYEKVRYALLNPHAPTEELERLQQQVAECIGKTEYVMVCTNFHTNYRTIGQKASFFANIGAHNVLFIRPDYTKELIEEYMEEYAVGISCIHNGITEMFKAYEEASALRERHFCMQRKNHVEESSESAVSASDISRFIQLMGTSRLDDADRFLVNLIQRTKRGEVSAHQFTEAMKQIIEKIKTTYAGIIETEGLHMDSLQNVFYYTTIDEYYEALGRIMAAINQKMDHEYDDYRNRLKIEQALEYINRHYQEDINMAMVSNDVSMNYSVFSLTFKEYTGQNFLNYLKEVRLKEAKKLLDETDKKVIEISSIVGYENEKHFMKTFKSIYGVTPSEYRKNIQLGRKERQL